METKNKSLAIITYLYEGVKNEDIDRLIKTFNILKLDTRYSSTLVDYVKELMLNKISEKVNKSKKKKIRIERMGEYNTKTFDCYIIEDNVLKRNGFNAKFTSIGKLYQAYIQIK